MRGSNPATTTTTSATATTATTNSNNTALKDVSKCFLSPVIKPVLLLLSHTTGHSNIFIIFSVTEKFENIGCDGFIYEFERHYLLAQLCVKLNKLEEGTHHIKKAVEGLKEEYDGKKFDMYEEYLNSCKEVFLATGA